MQVVVSRTGSLAMSRAAGLAPSDSSVSALSVLPASVFCFLFNDHSFHKMKKKQH